MFFENLKRPERKDSESLPDPNRRKFLQALGAGAAYVAINNIPGAKELVEEHTSPEDIRLETTRLKEGLEERYGISISFDAIDDAIESGLALSPVEQRDSLRELERSFSLYPKEYIGNTRLKDVHVVNNYTRMMNPFIGGLTNERTNPHPGRMLLNREGLLSKVTFEEFFSSDVPNTFHHELYHLSDDHDEHYEALQKNKTSFNAEWTKEHKLDGGAEYNPVVPIRSEGFPSSYAMTSPTEQRAVIAEFLMSNYTQLMDTAKNDVALTHAIEKVKQEFHQKSAGIMDETYWELMHSGEHDSIRKYIAAKETLTAE